MTTSLLPSFRSVNRVQTFPLLVVSILNLGPNRMRVFGVNVADKGRLGLPTTQLEGRTIEFRSKNYVLVGQPSLNGGERESDTSEVFNPYRLPWYRLRPVKWGLVGRTVTGVMPCLQSRDKKKVGKGLVSPHSTFPGFYYFLQGFKTLRVRNQVNK